MKVRRAVRDAMPAVLVVGSLVVTALSTLWAPTQSAAQGQPRIEHIAGDNIDVKMALYEVIQADGSKCEVIVVQHALSFDTHFDC